MPLLTEQVEAVVSGEKKGMLVVGLGRDGASCGVAVNPRHRALSFVKVWELVALADELAACELVLVLVPEGRFREPTRHEIESFSDLQARARRAGLTLLDCIVVRGNRSWSLRSLGIAADPGL
jgi:hypothetical protein